MSLNIKNPRVHSLAREAAQRTGQTQTSVIEQALEQYLRSLDSDADRRRQIDELVSEMAERIADSGGSLSTDGLYDQYGLPA